MIFAVFFVLVLEPQVLVLVLEPQLPSSPCPRAISH